jgi:hypothetical protein
MPDPTDKQAPETIDEAQLDDVTGGCGACCRPRGCGTASVQSRGFDPLFAMLAMQLFSSSSKPSS